MPHLKNAPTLGLVTSPISFGQKKPGVEKGPDFLLKQGLNEYLHESEIFKLQEYRQDAPKEQNPEIYQKVFDNTMAAAQENDFTFILGGDHSQSLATISALKKRHPDLVVLWVDAHADINTPASSLTDNLHGMPVAGLLGHFQSNFPWAHSGCLKKNEIGYLGLRALDEYEVDLLEDLEIVQFSAEQNSKYGTEFTLDKILSKIDPLKNRPIHISFDVDAIDARYMKATGLPIENGILPQHLIKMAYLVNQKRNLVSMEVVEFNPDEATSEEDLDCARNVIIRFCKEVLNFRFNSSENSKFAPGSISAHPKANHGQPSDSPYNRL